MASGRSVLDLATLAAACGSRVELDADGSDAEAALDALTDLIGRRFDEELVTVADRPSESGEVPHRFGLHEIDPAELANFLTLSDCRY